MHCIRRLTVSSALFISIAARAAFAISPEAPAQGGPVIDHDAIECVPITQFVELSADVTPAEQVRNCRIYFRSNAYPDFYFIDMEGVGEEFAAYLPKPAPETTSVIYYLECLDGAFLNSRTAELAATVVDSESACRRRDPGAIFFQGDNPGILVNAVSTASPAQPLGFSLEGLIPVAGAGIGAGAIAAIGAGGAAAAAAGAALLTSSEDPPSDPVPPPSDPVQSPPPGQPPMMPPGPMPAPLQACFETIPANGVIKSGEQITLDARCSTPDDITYRWELGDGRERTGPFVRPVYNAVGGFDVRLTVSTVADPLVESVALKSINVKQRRADVSVVKSVMKSCMDFNDTFEFKLVVRNLGPDTAENVVVTDNLPIQLALEDADPVCMTAGSDVVCALGDMSPGSVENVTILAKSVLDDQSEEQLEVSVPNMATVATDTFDPAIGNNDSVVVVTASSRCNDDIDQTRMFDVPRLDFTTRLDIDASGSTHGRVIVNGLHSVMVNRGAPIRGSVEGQIGRNTIEAHVVGSADAEGRFSFRFGNGDSFVPGRIRVESGDVLSLTADAVTFRVKEGTAERFRFTVVLEP